MRNHIPLSFITFLPPSFKQEGSIFEPELYDIYLSYCHKGSSKPQPKAPPHPPPAVIPLDDFPDSIFWMGGAGTSSSAPSSSSAAPPVYTHAIADKRSHTIYDSELHLILDCSEKTDAQAAKCIDEYTTFKHGSFLLYSQRGLLETHPLQYRCVSVSPNASVHEPTVVPLDTPAEGTVTGASQLTGGTKTTGYRFPTFGGGQRRQGGVAIEVERGDSEAQRVPPALADIMVVPKELVMNVDSLKSGVAYTAIIQFPYTVALTDLSIPASSYMASVSVDVWKGEGSEEEGGGVRVAHSSEIRDKSLMLGNLMPPPVCNYAKVTFVGKPGASREKAHVFLGSFFGRPVPPLPPSSFLLHSLEQRLLSEYFASRDRLSSALAGYASASHTQKLSEDQVTLSYQNCFKAQVSSN